MEKYVSKNFIYTLLTIVVLSWLYKSFTSLISIQYYTVIQFIPGATDPDGANSLLRFPYSTVVDIVSISFATFLIGCMFSLLRRKANISLSLIPVLYKNWSLILCQLRAIYNHEEVLYSLQILAPIPFYFLVVFLGAHFIRSLQRSEKYSGYNILQWPKNHKHRWITFILLVVLATLQSNFIDWFISPIRIWNQYSSAEILLYTLERSTSLDMGRNFILAPLPLKIISAFVVGITFSIVRQRTRIRFLIGTYFFAYVFNIGFPPYFKLNADSYTLSPNEIIAITLAMCAAAMAGAYFMRRFIARYPWNDEVEWEA